MKNPVIGLGILILGAMFLFMVAKGSWPAVWAALGQSTSVPYIPNATAIQNQVPVPGSPSHTTTPSGNFTTTFNPTP